MPGHRAELCRLWFACAPFLMQRGEDIPATPTDLWAKADCICGNSESVRHQRQGVQPGQNFETRALIFCLTSSLLFPFPLITHLCLIDTFIQKALKAWQPVDKPQAWEERGWVGRDKSSGVCKEDGKYEGLRQPQKVRKLYKNT